MSRDVRLVVALDEDEREKLAVAAQRTDRKLAVFIREAALAGAEEVARLPSSDPCEHGTPPGMFCFRCHKRI
jgi:hypothetical protein